MDFHDEDGRDVSESCAARFSVKTSRLCEFRVIIGIMTGLLGRCFLSTLVLSASDYVKTIASLGLWLHHSSSAPGCFTNDTGAAAAIQIRGKFRLAVIPLVAIRSHFFCSYHDSTAIMLCTKSCSDHCVRIKVKWNSHRIELRWKNR